MGLDAIQIDMMIARLQRAHRRVWDFRGQVSDVWKTPGRGDALDYAFCECAEALDADLRARRREDFRNRPELDTSVRSELAQCAVMVLSAMPIFDWTLPRFRDGLDMDCARAKTRIMDAGVFIRHARQFVDIEGLAVGIQPYEYTCLFLGSALSALYYLLGAEDFEQAIEDELTSRGEKIAYRQSWEYRYVHDGDTGCPYCGSQDVDYDTIEVEGLSAYQRASCGGCNAVWADSYLLTGIVPLEIPSLVEITQEQPVE